MSDPGTYRARRISGVISTDDIIPGRFKHMYTDTSKLARHVFENRFPGLAATLAEGDLIAADDTFGIGSSREQAVSSLLAAGVKGVIAPRFGRIFFRNAWNLGLLAIELNGAMLGEGEPVSVDIRCGRLVTARCTVNFTPPPREMLETLDAGGLLQRIAIRIHNSA